MRTKLDCRLDKRVKSYDNGSNNLYEKTMTRFASNYKNKVFGKFGFILRLAKTCELYLHVL